MIRKKQLFNDDYSAVEMNSMQDVAFNSSGADTAIVTPGGTATSVTIGTTTYAGDASTSFSEATGAGYNTIVMQDMDSARIELALDKTLIADQIRMSGNNGINGGAIYNNATMAISGSTFSGNIANRLGGAIYNSGTATLDIIGSTFSGNIAKEHGGAIYNSGTMTISGSTFSGNTAYYLGAICNSSIGTISILGSIFSGNTTTKKGGAIYNENTATISGSTFSGNTSNDNGGAIYSFGWINIIGSTFSGNTATTENGGAIYTWKTTIVSGSTFSGNIAKEDGGAIFNVGTATISDSTFSGNTATTRDGGALYNPNNGKIYVTDSIFNGNTATQGNGGAIYNLGVATISGSTFSGNFANGNSGAIYNQGSARVIIENCYFLTASDTIYNDSNYVQFKGTISLAGNLTTTKAITATGATILMDVSSYKAGNTVAIIDNIAQIANAASYGITVSATQALGEYQLAGGAAAFSGTLMLNGSTAITVNDGGVLLGGRAYVLTQSGGNLSLTVSLPVALLTASPTKFVKIGDVTHVGTWYDNISAAMADFDTIVMQKVDSARIELAIDKTLIADQIQMSGNSGSNLGGAIKGFTLTISGSTFSDNSANYFGGAIRGTTLTISGSTFIGNIVSGADGSGGAIKGFTLTISGSTFTDNTSTQGHGGAISTDNNGTLNISGSSFSNNSANRHGGAIHNSSGTLTISGSTFTNNVSTNGGYFQGDNWQPINGGGAIFNGGTATITDSTFCNNNSTETEARPGSGHGGGAIANNGTMTVSGSSFSLNSAGNDGGAIINEAGATLAVSGSTFSENWVDRDGGAIFNDYAGSRNGTATISGSTFTGNTAYGRGGAIYNSGMLTVSGSTFNDNSALDGGGAIYTTTIEGNSCAITIENCYFLTASDTIFNTGKAQMTFKGTVSLAGNLTSESAITATGATVLMDISRHENDGTVIISNLAQIVGAAGFGITISENQAGGVYKLAQGAGAFNGNITISNGKESSIFTYENGAYNSLTFGGVDYFLTNIGGTLALEVRAVVLISATQTDSLVINGATYTGKWYNSIDAASAYSIIAMQDVDSSRIVLPNGKTLIADQIRMTGNAGDKFGGAIESRNGTLTISGSTFTNNRANFDGGAIFSNGTTNISGSTFSGNTGGHGGAISGNGTLNVSGSTFSGNTANAGEGKGGAIYNYSIATVSDSSFSDNLSVADGGAIYNNGTMTVSGSTFTANTSNLGGYSGSNGGAIYNIGTATITDSIFSNNFAALTGNLLASAGGGAIANSGTLTVSGSTFSGNRANNNGGAIVNRNDATLQISGSTFSGNIANGNGGAIFNGYINSGKTGSTTISGSTFTGNIANENGGAIFNIGTVTVIGSTFSGNRAYNKGGAIYNSTYEGESCAITIENCYFLTASDTIFNTEKAQMTFKGTVSLAGNLTSESAINATGATILMDISSYKGGDNTVIISNLAQIVGAAEIGITVSEIQAFGKYTLAGGVAVSPESITIRARVGSGAESHIESGTFTYSATGYNKLSLGNSIYELTNVSGTLTLTATSSTAIITPNSTDSVVIGGVTYSGIWYGSDFGAADKLCKTIVMQNLDPARIDLTSGKTLIADQIRMTGNSGSNLGGAIYCRGTVTISGSTFSKNSAIDGGGALYTQNSKLTINGSTFSENSAAVGGAINNFYNSKLTINGSTFNKNSADNGGAIYSGSGEGTINGSIFTENTAKGGGAIENADTLTITDSLFRQNSANDGGAINNQAKMTISGSTFTGNHAGSGKGGAIWNWNDFPTTRADLTIRDSWFTTASDTIFNDGGIVRFEGTVSLAGNFSSTNSEIFAANATIVMDISGYYPDNAVEIISNMAQFQGAPEWAISVTTAQTLGTYTLAKGAADFKGNITIRCGNESGTFIYNNGVYSNSVVVGHGQYKLTNVDGTLKVTVTSAIALVTATQTDSVVINGATYTGLWFSSIHEALEATYPIIAMQNVDVTRFEIFGNKTVTVDQIRMSGNSTNGFVGGAIYNGATLTVNGSTFTNNKADASSNGGAIYNGSMLTVSGSTFSGNTGPNGGAIYNIGTATISGSTFTSNTATSDAVPNGNGGAIYNTGKGTISGSTFTNNRADFEGGAIYNTGKGTVSVTNSTFSGNTATSNGGAIFNAINGTLSVTNSTFSGNTATTEDGGAICNDGTATVSGSTFSGNTATNGGAIFNNVKLTVSGSTFADNTATTNGGAIYSTNQGTVSVTNSTFGGNTAANDNGGAIYNDGTVTVSGSTFNGNRATNGYGGAIFNAIGATVSVANSTFSGNTAAIGGAIYNDGTVTIENSYFTTATDTILNTGSMTFKGTVSLAGNLSSANNITADGATIVMDVSSYKPGNGTAIIDNIAQIVGAAGYGITVAANQAPGKYLLATGAAAFSGTLMLNGNTAITVNGDGVLYNNYMYMLTQSGGKLELNIGVAAALVTASTTNSVEIGGVTYIGSWFGSINEAISNSSSIAVQGIAITRFDLPTPSTRLIADQVSMSGNTDEKGGAIRNLAQLTFSNSTFTDNTGIQAGVVSNNGVLTVSGSTFSGNRATDGNGRGGVVYNNGAGRVDITGSTFQKNTAISGGVIFNYGKVTVSGSTFSENSVTEKGGVIYNDGTVTFSGSTFTNNSSTLNGGAIYNEINGTLTVIDSIFTSNVARKGGAIYNDGKLTLSGSTLSLNRATEAGAAIYNASGTLVVIGSVLQNNTGSSGAAIYSYGTVTFSGSTFSGNSAYYNGGAIYNSRKLTINSATFTDDTGATTVRGSTFSGNTATANGGAIYNIGAGTLDVSGATFSGNTATENGGAIYNTGTVTASAIFNGNIATSNGGAIYNAKMATVEGSTFSGNKASNGGAIYNTGTATVEGSTFSGNFATNGGAIYNTGTATVAGSTFSGNIAISGNGGAIFNAGAAATLDVIGSTFSGNSATNGGAIYNEGTLTVTDSTFSGNTASWGAIANFGKASFTDSVFSDNRGSDRSGAFYNEGAATFTGSTFSGNTADYGSAINSWGTASTVGISNSTFSKNSARLHGGAIYNRDGSALTVENSTFDSNASANWGGAIYNLDNELKISGSTFSKNTANSSGGAVESEGPTTITGSTFSGNTANWGGAIFSNGTLTVDGSTFSDNRATSTNGGAIYSMRTATITGSTFSGNQAKNNGGAVYCEGTLTVKNSSFDSNTAGDWGGAIHSLKGVLTLSNSTFSKNTAQKGGALYSIDTTTITGSTFSGNTATLYGGAQYNEGKATIIGSTFSGNSAAYDGGAIFNADKAIIDISGSTFSGNTANRYGGAIVNATLGTATISDSTFSGNFVGNTVYGGAIHNSGTMTIANSSFLTASDSIYNSGSLTLKGTVSLAGNLTNGFVITATGATIVMDISSYAPGNKVEIINNMAQLQNSAAAWGITVSADQANGEYLLAKGARDFYNKITISNGTESGTTSGGYSLVVGNKLFLLSRFSDSLTLTVKSATAIITGSQTDSVVINGATYTGDWYSDSGLIDAGCSTIVMQKVAPRRIELTYSQTLIADQVDFTGKATTGNGGAILNKGMATIIGSTFTRNKAVWGGAIHNSGTMTIEDSSFLTESDTVYNIGKLTLKGTVSLAGFFFSDSNITATDATIVMDISSYTSGNGGSIVNNMAKIQGAAGWGISVSATQANGNYVLALGAAEFKGNFTISSDKEKGTFTYSNGAYNSLVLGDKFYQLTNTGGKLTLTVKNPMAIITETTTDTVTINGVTYKGKWFSNVGAALGANCDTIVMQKVDSDRFDLGSGQTLIADQITISGRTSSDGGAIYNKGTALVIGSTFSGNSVLGGVYMYGGAIDNNGMATIKDSVFSDNSVYSGASVSYGGAIYNNGTATVSGSTFSGNYSASLGGAIFNAATLTVSNSTFSGNSASYGGAIFNTGSITIENSSFLTASDTIYNEYGNVTFKGTVSLAGNLFSSNNITATDATILLDVSSYKAGNTTEIINNMARIQGAAGWGITVSATQTNGDYVLALGAAEFKGNFTISNGKENGIFTYTNGAYNSVTFENAIYQLTNTDGKLTLTVKNPMAIITETETNSVTINGVTYKGKWFSNVGAALGANYDTIVMQKVDSDRFDLGSGQTLIADQITISGRTSSDGGAIYNGMLGTATITGSTFSGNSVLGGADDMFGGAIDNNGMATIKDSVFSGNSVYSGASVSYGGAIYNNGVATVSGSTFSGNYSASYGGAICNQGSITIENSSFLTASDTIYNERNMTLKGTVSLAGNLFSFNDITATDATILLDVSSYKAGNTEEIINNMARIQGAAGWGITVSATQANGDYVLAKGAADFKGNFTISNGKENGIFTYTNGAYNSVTFENAIYQLTNTDGKLTLTVKNPMAIITETETNSVTINGVTYKGKWFSNVGAALGANYDTIVMQKVNSDRFDLGSGQTLTADQITITGRSSSEGGAIYNKGTALVTGSTFSGNSALGGDFVLGGAIDNDGMATIKDSVFSGNSVYSGASVSYGGAIYNNGVATVSGSTFSGNSAGMGGAIANLATLTISNSTFSGNSAGYGGAIANLGSITIENSSFLTASDTIYNERNMTLKGTVSLAGNLFSFDDITATGATILLDVSSYKAGNTTEIISNMAQIIDAAGWGITVSATQALGDYVLAKGAAEFKGNFTISNGKVSGTFTYDNGAYNAVELGNYIYTLNNNGGKLQLTVNESIANPWYTPESTAPSKLQVAANNASGNFYGNGQSALVGNHTYNGTYYGGGTASGSGDLFSAVQNVVNSALTVIGGNNGAALTGNSWLDISGSTLGAVYGGSANADTTGDINLNMTDSTVNYLYGNAIGAANNVNLNLFGTSRINTELQGGVLNANLKGASTVKITGATTGSGVTLGNGKSDFLLFTGLKAAASGDAALSYTQDGKSTLNIVNATLNAKSYLFGGGYAMSYGAGRVTTTVSGGTALSLDKVTVVGNSVIYGGGRAYGNATSVVTGGVKLALSNLMLDTGSVLTVYGGGLADSIGSATVSGGVRISVDGQMSGKGRLNIYGGGQRSGATVDSVRIEIGNPNEGLQSIAIGNVYAGGAGGAKVTGTGEIYFMGANIAVSGAVSGDNGSSDRTVAGERSLFFDRARVAFTSTAKLANFDVVKLDSDSRITFAGAPDLSTVNQFAWTVEQASLPSNGSLISFAGAPTWKSDVNFTLTINDILEAGSYTFMTGENLSALAGKSVNFVIGGLGAETLTSTIGGAAVNWNDWDITFALDESKQKLSLAFAKSSAVPAANRGNDDLSWMVNSLALERTSNAMSEALAGNSNDWDKKNHGMLA